MSGIFWSFFKACAVGNVARRILMAGLMFFILSQWAFCGDICFSAGSGAVENRYVINGGTHCHIMLKNGEKGRIRICFPCGNWCSSFDFKGENVKLSLKGEPKAVCHKNGEATSHGVRFGVSASGKSLVLDNILLDHAGMVRDSESNPEKYEDKIEVRSSFARMMDMEEAGNVYPQIVAKESEIQVFRKTLDGRNLLQCRIILPDKVSAHAEEGKEGRVELSSASGQPLNFDMEVTSDYKPVSSLALDSILNNETLEFVEKMKSSASAPEIENGLNSLRFLLCGDRLMTGSGSCSGRDTALSTLLIADIIRPSICEKSIQTVLNGLSESGDVASSEDTGCSAIDHRLYELVSTFAFIDNPILKEKMMKDLSLPVFHYDAEGEDLYLPVMVARYIKDGFVPAERKMNFLLKNARNGSVRIKNVQLILQNFERVLEMTEPYALSGDSADLIREKSGNYPAGINCVVAPSALTGIRDFLNSNLFTDKQLLELCGTCSLARVKEAIEDGETLDKRIKRWNGALIHYYITLKPDEMKKRLKVYFKNSGISRQERAYLLSIPLNGDMDVKDFVYSKKVPPSLKQGLRFMAVSLDDKLRPVEVMTYAEGMRLLLNEPSPFKIDEILTVLNTPYPLGLMGPEGVYTKNTLYSRDKKAWKAPQYEEYGIAIIEQGLLRQARRMMGVPGRQFEVENLMKTLKSMLSQDMDRDNGAVQIWNTVFISTLKGFMAQSERLKELQD